MERTAVPLVGQPTTQANRGATRTGAPALAAHRVRVQGKYLARGANRLRIRGVTYGPFAPNAAGEPLPAPGRARKDFALMRAAGVNCVRTYHVPPEWFLRLADEHGVGVFINVPWPKHLCFPEGAGVRGEARRLVHRAARLRAQFASHGAQVFDGLAHELGLTRMEPRGRARGAAGPSEVEGGL
jgi:Glycosyl hydrolases family 2, TIM barrel domain